MDSSFVKATVQVPHLSGFDKSHQNLFTSHVGTITPILFDELIPGSKVHCKVALSAQLPPLASDTFMRCSIKLEAFAVPLRLLCGSFESWFTDKPVKFASSFTASGSVNVPSFAERVGFLPCIGGLDDTATPSEWAPFEAVGSLADYLGMRSYPNGGFSQEVISALPFLCYHRVYDDWYRNSLVQNPVFVHPSLANNAGNNMSPGSFQISASTAPYYFYSEKIVAATTGSTFVNNYIFQTPMQLKLADGKYLYELRQRNFGLDYFTTATPSPQQGPAMVVGFGSDSLYGNMPASGGAGDSTHFSIAALRAANSLQQFKERNNLAGNYFVDVCRARYGSRPSDGIAQRSILLGSASYDVYTKGIYQTAQGDGSVSPNNPFGDSVASRQGSAYASGNDFVLNFSVNEPCYFLINATLVPKVTYSSGVERYFSRYIGAGSLTDMANPILQNVGPEPIWTYELNGMYGAQPTVFGYTDRYGSFKTKFDTLHGILRDGSSLQSFALQRNFTSSVLSINSSFLEIPKTYLDQVCATSSNVSTYGYWCDTFFDYKVSMPLNKYSLPSLQDPAYEHGQQVTINKSGSKLG